MKHRIKISSIKVPRSYQLSNPQRDKMNACRTYFRQNGRIDRDIVVNKSNTIKDGYIGYLVLKENGIEETDVIQLTGSNTYKNNPTLYVYAHHKYKSKVYTWRMTSKTKNAGDLKVGSRIIVETKNGTKAVIVDGFEVLNAPPVSTPVKRVVKCLKD